MRLAINGFGRIGRAAFKIAAENPEIEIVGINDLTDAKTLAHLLKYDTAYGSYNREIKAEGNDLVLDGKKIPISAIKEPTELPWKELQVDVVLECTGRFVKSEDAGMHIKAGAKKVIISAPSKGENPAPTYVLGVNGDTYKGETVINNASCTTNCIAPVMKVLNDKFGVKKAILDTIHAYTHDQNLQDGPHKDLRRARAAACNMVPTSTGAAIAATEVIPDLKGKFDGTSIRVPIPVGSISDITVVLAKPATVEEINNALIEASKTEQLTGIMTTTNEPIVSSDIVGNPSSSIVDLGMTQVVDGDLAKVFAWYDNEWGYSNRLVELAVKITSPKNSDVTVEPKDDKVEPPKQDLPSKPTEDKFSTIKPETVVPKPIIDEDKFDTQIHKSDFEPIVPEMIHDNTSQISNASLKIPMKHDEIHTEKTASIIPDEVSTADKPKDNQQFITPKIIDDNISTDATQDNHDKQPVKIDADQKL